MNRHQATPPLSRDELPSPADLRPALRHRLGGGPVALRHLCWKEVRQVLPLVWMVLGLGVCVQLLLLLLSDRAFVPRFFLVFAGMPSLFAVGAGVLLVGQEKERRTLDWMRSLPIGPADLMAVKLATGLFALAGVWGLNLLLVVLVKVASGRWPTATTADALLNPAGWVYLWPLQSIFLLLAGFTTAWFFRSSLVALLALIPLALLPGLIAEGADVVYRWLGGSPWLWGDSLPWLKVVSLIVLIPPLWLAGWRRGLRFLRPEQVSARRSPWRRTEQVPLGEAEIWSRPVYTPAAMLIWQFVRQNRTVLKGIGAMLLVALGLLATTPDLYRLVLGIINDPTGALGLLATTPDLRNGRAAVAALFGLLAASWLGVLAFHGDGLQDRIHFLADRGVSPAKIWWTRHAPPLSLLAIAAALMVLVLPAPLRSACLSAEGLLCAVAVVLFPYTVSQAVGQVIHSATIAAIAAPVVTWVLAAYGVYMVSFLGVPAWLLAACAMLPWLTTCLLMRRWMDGRGGWGFWGGHAGFLAVGLVLPLVPEGWVLFSQPTMPGEVRREVTAESRRYGPMFAEPRELVLRFRRPESPDVPAANRRAEAEIVYEQLVHDLSVDPGAIRFERRVMAYLLGEAHLARMTLEQGGDAEESRRRYRRTLTLVGTLVERLRMSWRLFDQDGADLIEIRLVRQLTSSEARSWLGPELHARLVQAVGDDRGRSAARRRAVVMSWAEYRTRVHAPESRFGGYAWQGEPASALMRTNAFFRRRAADYLAWRMLQRLERSEPATSPERTKELARYWNVADSLYGLGPGGEYWRADDVGAFATQFDSYARCAPGSQWHAGWERTARELLDKLDKSEAQR